MWRPDYIESLAGLGRFAQAREQLHVLGIEALAVGRPSGGPLPGAASGHPQMAVALLEETVDIAETSAGSFERAWIRPCLG